MRPLVLALSVFALVVSCAAQDPIRYSVSFSKPHTHYLEVVATVPVTAPDVELYMAVWTPGSYLVREYARNVEDFRARTPQGQALAWQKTRKNRWRVETSGAKTIELSYRVYAHELSVQGNWVDAGFAMLNGAANFITVVSADHRPYEVTLKLPDAWKKCISGMNPGPTPNSWIAKDFDELLDSPIYAGNAPIHEFEVDGKKHYLVNEGEDVMWDGPASARDVQKIVAEYSRQWHGLPYEKYVFFNIIAESGGGLEHRNSTWMGTSRWAYGNTQAPQDEPQNESESPRRRRPNRQSWLGLVSHEYFHLWNVKRMRPVELGPFDYENEVYTRSLWLAEGVTSYYGPLAVRRAGLSNDRQLLRELSNAIRQLQTTPGHLAQSAEEASFDAWIKLYRPNENSRNTSISYYTKGEVVGFLLDAHIRRATNNTRSLDDVLRLAFQRYAGTDGYTPQQFREVASEVAGRDLSQWFKTAVESTKELDYGEVLEWYGLRFREEPQRQGAPARVYTGLTTKNDEGRILVTAVQRGTPGEDSGINVDDEILAVNGYRVRAEQWPARLENYKEGTTVDVLLARRDKLITLKLTVAPRPPAAWSLEVRPDATEEQKSHLRSWLGD